MNRKPIEIPQWFLHAIDDVVGMLSSPTLILTVLPPTSAGTLRQWLYGVYAERRLACANAEGLDIAMNEIRSHLADTTTGRDIGAPAFLLKEHGNEHGCCCDWICTGWALYLSVLDSIEG